MMPAPRRAAPHLLALIFAFGLLGSPAGAPVVRAATPDLTIVSDARYVVEPAQKRVRVTVTLRLTNHLQDTATKRYYFDEAFLAVLPGASGFKLTGGSGGARASVSRRTAAATILRLGLGSRLFGGKAATYTLRFDLKDPGGDASRDLRIGDSLASFPVWAFASDGTPGSSVTVVFPAGYETTVEAGKIPAPSRDGNGRTIYRTGGLGTPLTFFAYLVGDRPGAYAERSMATTVNGTSVPLTIRAWADDKTWAKRVGNLVEHALPALGRAIGLPWPRDDTLVIQEAVSRSTGGYAGLFDPTEGLVEVAYYADDFVVLHESAHGWFNGSLLADRWANEAFASYYGLAAADELHVSATGNKLTKALRKSAIPLNAWGAVGKETTAVEDYAYAASLTLARAIGERAGPVGLRAVWADAAGRIGAYQPPLAGADTATAQPAGTSDAELGAGPPDWRGLLDLLEADTPATYDDLWRTWVARDEDMALLDARAEARSRYDAMVRLAADWQLPRSVRDALRAWRFDDATALLGDAATVLTRRARIQSAATDTGLTLPSTLRDAFEGTDGFAEALDEATAESDAIVRYRAAADTEPAAPDVMTSMGLWGSTPQVDLARARTAFAAGDLAASVALADSARSTWASAAAVGQGRAVSAVALGLAIIVALTLLGISIRSRRRRPTTFGSAARSRMMARPMGADMGVDGPQLYATLAATPEEPPSVAADDVSDTGAGSA